jgi:DNA-binding MarR family transcriptional regulator
MGHMRGAVDEGMDLTYNQYKALLALSAIGPCTLNVLSRDLKVATSSASQMAERLVGMGLIARSQGDDDRRQVALETTNLGETLIEEIRAGIVHRYHDLFRHLEADDQRELASSMSLMVDILEKAMKQEDKEV